MTGVTAGRDIGDESCEGIHPGVGLDRVLAGELRVGGGGGPEGDPHFPFTLALLVEGQAFLNAFLKAGAGRQVFCQQGRGARLGGLIGGAQGGQDQGLTIREVMGDAAGGAAGG